MKWSREATLACALVLLIAVAAILDPKFVSVRAQTLLATHLWELAIVAVPMLLIIIAGGIDLSVGSMVALGAVALGLAFEKGVPPIAAALLAVVVASLAGCANGALVAKTKTHPLLITLASMAAYRGLAEGLSLARPISGYPASFLSLGQGFLPPIVFALVAIGAGLVLKEGVFGRWVYAVGHEETVSRFTKIPVDRLKIWLYTFSGLAAGLASVILVARNNTAKADLGMGMELEAITAVVLGGASIDGGKGRVTGLVLGLFLIHETREFVSWHWRQSELNLIVIGGLLIIGVLFDGLQRSRKPRVLAQNGS